MQVVSICADAQMQRRIGAALSGPEMKAVVQLHSPTGLGELAADASVVIVFVCDIDAAREIAGLRRLSREASEPAIVAVSPPSTGAGVRRALDAGADGLVFENELELTLAATVRAVAIGQSVVPSKLRAGVERPVLSHREQQVLGLVRRGLTNAEIAKQLFLAESTIKSHVASIFTKFGVRSRKEVVAASDDLERAQAAA
jgi:DNA-binding NarL/FixJ family response regulator